MNNGKVFILIFCSVIFSLMLSHNQSQTLYHNIGISNYYATLFIDVLINFSLALLVVKVVSKLKFFEHYHTFIMNHFSHKTGKFVSGIVHLFLFFLILLLIMLLVEPDYVVDFLGYHLLFASIFSIDSLMISEPKQDY